MNIALSLRQLGGLGLVCLVIMAAGRAVVAAPPTKASSWKKDVISAEQRQTYVMNRVERVNIRFRALITDLESNGILGEKESQEMLAAIDVLAKVKNENVQQAILSLRAARRGTGGAGKYLDKADIHVDIAVKDLTALLRLANALESSQVLRQQLRQLLRLEEALWTECKNAGRAELEGTPVAPAEVVTMATRQSNLEKDAAKLLAMFPAAITEAVLAEEKQRVKKAAKVYAEGQVEALLASAAGSIDEGDFIGAVGPQKEAIDVLKQVDQLLKSGKSDFASDLTQMLSTLNDILLKQRELRKQTEAADPAKFKSQQRPLQGRQRDLYSRLNKVDAGQFRPETEDQTNPVQDAIKAMDDSVTALGAAQQKETIGHQREAEAALERAIAMLEKKIAQQSAASDPVEALRALADLLKEVLKEQIALREGTQEKAKGNQDVTSQTAPQQDIMDRTIPAVEMEEADRLTIQKALGKALFGMESAVEALKKNEATTAVPQQINAEEGLAEALRAIESELEKELAQGDDDAEDLLDELNMLVELLKKLLAQQKAVNVSTQTLSKNNQSIASQTPTQQDIMDRTIPTVEMEGAESLAIQQALGKALSGMEAAIEALRVNNSTNALPAQKQAAEGLAEALGAAELKLDELKAEAKKQAELEAELAQLDATHKAAEQILAEQKKITADSKEAAKAAAAEATPAESQAAAAAAKAAQAAQKALAQKTDQAAQNAAPEAKSDVQKAAEAMKAAAEALKAGDQKEAEDQQAMAEEALKSAASKAAKAKNSKASNNKKDKGKRGGKMKGKGKSKGAKGSSSKDSKGEGEGGTPTPGSSPPKPPKLAPLKLTGKNIDAKGQERYFSKGEVSGERSDDKTSDWKTLGHRKQEVLTDRYIQQLPVEYRELLKNYYQSLSTDD
jgi:hypothetical protein